MTVAQSLVNLLIASTPGGIEAQEAQGQRDLCNSAKLPVKGAVGNQDKLQAMGITLGDQLDDLFIAATLPEGWRIAPTEHSMHSDLLDGKGRKRAGIFYKAAFYDRSAHMHLTRRYSYGYRPVGGWENKARHAAWEGYVADHAGDLFITSATEAEPEFNRDAPEVWRSWIETRDAKVDEAKTWLVANYPEWENPLAYWE